ncbi:sigma 54-interacting transcriptional regulator [Escherichia coli]|uniref:Predicted DNA-binding transcriptional regulator n=1 Tax=Escherichia coli (strain ATCC 9637 / CCM 2024 / DSM 1116 / LMG 11080 / NBRC 13500 / NCIMB 8666 / NRRL B-766 / W) TaxID=566546 RepID=E0IWE4_ECOLW|nr:sigma-54-dependent Fis family transcriptional regulator [Escherichia coli]EFA4150729.1 sigma-54-dependent transcriptional regulator [Escherichia coli O166:H49]MCF0250311.1 sigma-54-dependent transcriptional regulator [Shigella flexneri]ADT76500.1 predicted DNA-binding transcriptional regulator [Escherichia coli W]AFH12698.1 putative DNA-binding transcriptional regulator [Escherichia coli W]AUT07843.1 sigma-54-dependent Fis family transcriptional regulator [Escherichia coli]
MELATTQSVLMQIQPTIQRFARMLASVLQLEVEIVDENLCRVAGTGAYGKFLGRQLSGNSRLLRHVLETKTEKVVTQSRFDPLCEGCDSKENCREKAFLGTPVILQDRCVGVISLIAVTHEQQEHISDNLREFSDYVRHISTIFVSKLLEDQGPGDNISKIFATMIDNMDQGVLVIDDESRVQFVNQTALKTLGVVQNNIIGKPIRFRPLTFESNFTHGHMQHIVSWDDKSELIIGQLHNIQGRQLFLMAFHQSHTSFSVANAPDEPHIEQLVGECRVMRQLKRLISRIAPSPSSVMVVGESGTGKEVVARAIHKLSGRRNKPFIAINCAAIPEQLLESELFGYVKGAFTGASANGKTGLIQAANTGTLFLDEIGDMPLMLQAKLLRAIEAREILPIGASSPIQVDIRIISATNQNLAQFIAEGKFREDLFYRLNVIPITLPPLRERQEDIELLVHYFLHLHTRRLGSVYPGIAPDVVEILRKHRWPGNLRELSNLMEYLVNVVPSGEVIDSTLLPPNLLNNGTTEQSDATEVSEAHLSLDDAGGTALEEMEKQMIREALSRHNSKKQVADELGIGIATLYRKIKKYELLNT